MYMQQDDASNLIARALNPAPAEQNLNYQLTDNNDRTIH